MYEPVEEGSYVKMIDIATEHGGRLEVIPLHPLLLL